MLAAISAAELKGDLSFLASDALEGRYTPSPGLEVAAEFIASKFRAAGLEPAGDRDYFQIANMVDRKMGKPESDLTLRSGLRTITVPAAALAISEASEAAKIERAPVLLVADHSPQALKKLDLTGKAVLIEAPDYGKLPREKAMAAYEEMQAFEKALGSSKAALEILITASKPNQVRTKFEPAEEAEQHVVPVVRAKSEELEKLSGSNGDNWTASIDIPAPEIRKAAVKNVIGVLRGSDPALSDTCVMLTAHYDHIGTIETGRTLSPEPKKETTDRIYNGANDDGSGTVSVLEIARALARTNPHPRRSIVFMTFFGEERGELGSEFYGGHPVFPAGKTVADINLEQVGRTDSNTGPQVNTASLTGYDYSEVTKYLEDAGKLTGIKVYKDPEASEQYFTQSDNYALAQQGIPAHSLTVAFEYPDYHGLGDEWQKIDYENMARVDRMIALALLNLANSPKAPAWNAQNAKTAPYREAQQKSRTSSGT